MPLNKVPMIAIGRKTLPKTFNKLLGLKIDLMAFIKPPLNMPTIDSSKPPPGEGATAPAPAVAGEGEIFCFCASSAASLSSSLRKKASAPVALAPPFKETSF